MQNPKSWADKTNRKYSLAVVIGRFQPFHNGHVALINEAFKIADKVLVLVGSAFSAPNIKNPFSFDQREASISGQFPDAHVEPLEDDLYSDTHWIAQVQSHVNLRTTPDDDVVIVGHRKDGSSYYLDLFPEYDVHEMPHKEILHSTTIREIYFGQGMIPMNVMPSNVEKFLQDFKKKPEYSRIAEEFKFIEDYKPKHKFVGASYNPVFVTTDAVVINNGYILLVKRRVAPGKGLWALPGGFLGDNDTIEESMLRELEEETRIKVPKDKLEAAIRHSHVFGAPGRSLRGRVVTHAFLLSLHEKRNPRVRGSDDAVRAKWFSISDIYDMQDQLFEDHFSIISYMLNKA